MRKRSSASAGATYLNKAERLAELRSAAILAASRMPSIRRVLLFGSLVNGVPTPRSDADILVEVGESSHLCPRDRIPEVLAAFGPLPCPVDLFVATTAEIEGPATRSPVIRLAAETGVDLLAPTGI